MHTEWSYDNVEGPKYPAFPRLPRNLRRVEASFIPDSNPTSEILEVSSLHKGDEELERHVVREVGRKRGKRNGEEGVWVEREYNILAVLERKPLFVFGGEGKAR